MLVTWAAQLEIDAELSHSITNVEVKFSLAKASGPDFDNLIEAIKKEASSLQMRNQLTGAISCQAKLGLSCLDATWFVRLVRGIVLSGR